MWPISSTEGSEGSIGWYISRLYYLDSTICKIDLLANISAIAAYIDHRARELSNYTIDPSVIINLSCWGNFLDFGII